MIKSTVQIITHTQGNRSRFSAPASFSLTDDGFALHYLDGNENVTLKFTQSSLTMNKSQSLFAVFQKGMEGSFHLKMGAEEGLLPLQTHEYLLEQINARTYRCKLGYALRFQNNLTKYRLLITVKMNSEEK